MTAVKFSKADFKDARANARIARIAYGYDPATPEDGDGEEDEGVDQIEQDAWYGDEYSDGNGEETGGYGTVGLGGE